MHALMTFDTNVAIEPPAKASFYPHIQPIHCHQRTIIHTVTQQEDIASWTSELLSSSQKSSYLGKGHERNRYGSKCEYDMVISVAYKIQFGSKVNQSLIELDTSSSVAFKNC